MRKFCCLFLALSVLNLSIFASAPLTRGTVVYIRTMSEVSSKGSHSVDAIVDADVKTSNGAVAIKKGTRVNVGLQTKKARGVGKPGVIELKSLSTVSVDGQTIYLAGIANEKGENKCGLALGLGLGLGLCVFPVFLAFLAKKGGQAVIPAGTVFNHFSVVDEYEIAL